jgi:bifunctional DNA-binding transcriptional regulator/antitoxin component of YhaV-PrlF toxin-antitoxin module
MLLQLICSQARAKITFGGRITISLNLRTALRLLAGDKVEFVAMEDGQFMMAAARLPNPRKSPGAGKRGSRG